MTGPTLLRGRVASTVWFGLRGVRTWRGPAGLRPKLQTKGQEKKVTRVTYKHFISHYFFHIFPPVFVKLDGKIRHYTHGFISKGHFHLDYPCTAREGARYFQTFSLYGWKPNLNGKKEEHAVLRATISCNMSPGKPILTVFGGLYAPMGMPMPPPRSKRSSRPPLTGALKAGGTAAGGAPKPAPICQ